jgi:hypothetical protein
VDGGAEVSAGSGNETDYTFVSQFGRVNYSYDNKYIFKASIRRDDSSRFGKTIDLVFFPAFCWMDYFRGRFLKDNETISF